MFELIDQLFIIHRTVIHPTTLLNLLYEFYFILFSIYFLHRKELRILPESIFRR